MNREEEKKLINKIIDGDYKAFEQILENYDKKVYGFIYKIVRDPYTAQDLSQETFIKVYENIHKFDQSKLFITWLFTIAKNTAYKYLEKNRKVQLFDIKEDLDSVEASNKSSFSNNPEKIFERKQEYEELCKIIDELPYKYKILIQLKYIEKLSYKEISALLNISEKKVDSRLYTARQKVIKRFKKFQNGKGQVMELWNAAKQ